MGSSSSAAAAATTKSSKLDFFTRFFHRIFALLTLTWIDLKKSQGLAFDRSDLNCCQGFKVVEHVRYLVHVFDAGTFSCLQFSTSVATKARGKLILPTADEMLDIRFLPGIGVEAPRNSLEFPREASQSYQVIDEDIPYSCQVEYHPCEANHCSLQTPSEWLIDAEISNRSQERCIRPNLVARLMGMDTLPSETKHMIHGKERKKKLVCNENHNIAPAHHESLILKSMKQQNKKLLPSVGHNSSQHMSHLSTKPKPREHPQQDLLQRFKKDFEAWQSSKVWENARTLKLKYESLNVCEPGNGKETSSLDFDGVKAVGNMDAKKCSCVKKTESRNCVSLAKQKKDAKKEDLHKSEGWINGKNKYLKSKENGLWDRVISNSVVLSAEGKGQISSSPRRIVIIQPSIEMSNDTEFSWLPSPERARKEFDMQEFLEQVKKKLEFEVQEKNRFNSQTRWAKDDTFFNQISFDTKRVKENVTKNYNPTLLRSTSNRFASEIQSIKLKVPQLVTESPQRLFSEKMKNRVKDEKDVQFPSAICGRSTLSTKVEAMVRPTHYFTKKDKEGEYRKNVSFLYDYCHDMVSNCEEVPSRKLVRSLSAPITTTTFGNLLSDNKQEKTEAEINGKHEASEDELIKAQKVRKDSFNIKNKVSSLRHNLITTGKLLGKKMHLIDEATMDVTPFLRTNVFAESIIMNSDLLQDNLTEVPPSPASVCSSSYDFYKPGYPSPVSPLEASFVEEHATSQVLVELSSYFPELDQEGIVKDEKPEEGVRKPMHISNEALEAEYDMKSFVRDVLVISRLFDREPFNYLFAGCDSLTKPIPKWVYYKVEEKYNNSRSEPRAHLSCNDQAQLSHRMLFDVLNEGFLEVVQTSKASFASREWYFGPRRIPLGEKLLDNIWDQIQLLAKPIADGSYDLNCIVNWDLNRTLWSAAYKGGTCEIGVEVELLILRDLIDELVLELNS